MALTDSDVSLPREGSEPSLVTADDTTLSHVAVVGAQAAPGIVLNGSVVDVRSVVDLLFGFYTKLLADFYSNLQNLC